MLFAVVELPPKALNAPPPVPLLKSGTKLLRNFDLKLFPPFDFFRANGTGICCDATPVYSPKAGVLVELIVTAGIGAEGLEKLSEDGGGESGSGGITTEVLLELFGVLVATDTPPSPPIVAELVWNSVFA